MIIIIIITFYPHTWETLINQEYTETFTFVFLFEHVNISE